MRIRKSSFSSLASISPASSSSSPPSSDSSIFTGINLASSTDSYSSFFSPYQSTSVTKCQGLDLLVKAIHMVTAGSVVGVPYIQKRIVRRRRRTTEFERFIIAQSSPFDEKRGENVKTRSMIKRQKKINGFPYKKYRFFSR